ncbi:MAG TPA: deoxyribodipyrimidine photo-lyase [Pyrinomonadaceae bacterium]|nr:deoxyribodipyrimidine photo-lyase [Chloracidobacterium sp.]MBP9935070.1 deoxyribodipyrimidine photo-lyase [Pyrinomonadaceae bacterium]MBL0241613.1 deoxyribodipyrimidine photo-lyase [Chloracidobacterium sp.]HQX54772.1 deoxyribodipyrimidine photo-lyase [Pyrinomonadaceae bacterium]HQY65684.1 deoxyribodipyrimidine photo-lyase [Pyrinomonadaceae bacterium]
MRINERVIALNNKPVNSNARYVLYWMQMYKRVDNNHALIYAIRRANELKLPLVVYEGLKYYYPWASDRLHTFILEGVEEKRREFERLGIRYVFYLQKDKDSPKQTVAALAKDAALIVTDDFPCFIIPEHNRRIAERADIPVFVVDSNGVIPMSKFDKEEYAAYTIRPKIKKLLDRYLVPLANEAVDITSLGLEVDCPETLITADNIAQLVSECDIDHSVPASGHYRGGTTAGRARLSKFVNDILTDYDKARSKPDRDGSSRLSSYLHFGYLSPIEIALAVRDADAPQESIDAYLEELIVRRELSYNMTLFNPKYDTLEALPAWVHKTMREHAGDERQFTYTLEQLEAGETHDELWNAAQREMTVTGEIHNYVRMLWGKNVIAWSPSYEVAFETLVHLNNKYCLDGRNPNSYCGILWCFGKHDRPWMERAVFGQIRYMTSGSTGKKFDSKKYIEWTKCLA